MSPGNVAPTRQAYWISRDDWAELENALFFAWMDGPNNPNSDTISAVLTDMGIAEARLESSTLGHVAQWRVALGKDETDLFISLSEAERRAIQPALEYVTSDRLKKLLT